MSNLTQQTEKFTEHDLCNMIKKELPETRNMVREMGAVMVFLKNLNLALDTVNARTTKKIVIKIEFEE